MDIDIEQCRENDKIKEIISTSGLPIKYIKLLLRLSDTIYINGINYNVNIDDNKVIILLISSKPDNVNGVFNTYPITNILDKLRLMEKENDDLKTHCEVESDLFKILIEINR
ncbi:MAG: hypothetical protein A4E25_00195 [Methanobacterium sp. PtaB.Bin024]|nr:MAG: hypothetical protein A4E25_00195 [Methanobacterium sp. PtaB.Bin024]